MKVKLRCGSRAVWTFSRKAGDTERRAQQQGAHAHSLVMALISLTSGGQTSSGCKDWKHLCQNAAIFTAKIKNKPVPELNFHRTDKYGLFSHTQRHVPQVLSHTCDVGCVHLSAVYTLSTKSWNHSTMYNISMLLLECLLKWAINKETESWCGSGRLSWDSQDTGRHCWPPPSHGMQCYIQKRFNLKIILLTERYIFWTLMKSILSKEDTQKCMTIWNRTMRHEPQNSGYPPFFLIGLWFPNGNPLRAGIWISLYNWQVSMGTDYERMVK